MTGIIDHIRACGEQPAKLAELLISEARCACQSMAKEINRLTAERDYALATAKDLSGQFNLEREKSRTAYFAALDDLKAKIDQAPSVNRELVLSFINGLRQ